MLLVRLIEKKEKIMLKNARNIKVGDIVNTIFGLQKVTKICFFKTNDSDCIGRVYYGKWHTALMNHPYEIEDKSRNTVPFAESIIMEHLDEVAFESSGNSQTLSFENDGLFDEEDNEDVEVSEDDAAFDEELDSEILNERNLVEN